jgi:CRP-like cAMP-binding protein
MNIPEYFKKKANLSDEAEKIVQATFIREELPQGHFLFKRDEICRHIFFIEQGFARVYYFSESGREITAEFFSENSFITAIDSFYHHKPTKDYCVLTEDSVVYSISYSEFKTLFGKHHEIAKFGFHVIFNMAKEMTEYISNLKFQTAEDKYNALLAKNPNILQRVSLGNIASYLGITQETLSRIRGGK